MNPFSIIGTGVAFANYKKAKAERDALIEQKEALEAVIDTYNSQLSDAKEKALDTLDGNKIDYPDGLRVSSILRVGNLVGNLMRAKKSLVITNISSKAYTIVNPDLGCKVFGDSVGLVKISSDFKPVSNEELVVNSTILINPGQTVEISSKNSIAGFVNEETLGKLRDYICEQSREEYITRCGKISLDGIETADIIFQWQEGNNDSPDKWKVAAWLGKPGVLRYCMEAFYA